VSLVGRTGTAEKTVRANLDGDLLYLNRIGRGGADVTLEPVSPWRTGRSRSSRRRSGRQSLTGILHLDGAETDL